MTSEERRAWTQGLLAAITFTGYVVVVGVQAGRMPVAEVPYIAPMLWAVGASIVLSIVVSIATSIARPGRSDQRDREIYRLGQFIGQGWLVLAAVGALIMAMIHTEHFWIANVLYVGFTLSAITSSIARVIAYRGGFQSW